MISDFDAKEAYSNLVDFLRDTYHSLDKLIRSEECMRMMDVKVFPPENWKLLTEAWNEYSRFWEDTWTTTRGVIYETDPLALVAGGLPEALQVLRSAEPLHHQPVAEAVKWLRS